MPTRTVTILGSPFVPPNATKILFMPSVSYFFKVDSNADSRVEKILYYKDGYENIRSPRLGFFLLISIICFGYLINGLLTHISYSFKVERVLLPSFRLAFAANIYGREVS